MSLFEAFKDTTGMSTNQCRLVITYFSSLIVQAIVLVYITPDKFKMQSFMLLMMLNIIYNITWARFFSD